MACGKDEGDDLIRLRAGASRRFIAQAVRRPPWTGIGHWLLGNHQSTILCSGNSDIHLAFRRYGVTSWRCDWCEAGS